MKWFIRTQFIEETTYEIDEGNTKQEAEELFNLWMGNKYSDLQVELRECINTKEEIISIEPKGE